MKTYKLKRNKKLNTLVKKHIKKGGIAFPRFYTPKKTPVQTSMFLFQNKKPEPSQILEDQGNENDNINNEYIDNDNIDNVNNDNIDNVINDNNNENTTVYDNRCEENLRSSKYHFSLSEIDRFEPGSDYKLLLFKDPYIKGSIATPHLDSRGNYIYVNEKNPTLYYVRESNPPLYRQNNNKFSCYYDVHEKKKWFGGKTAKRKTAKRKTTKRKTAKRKI
jgi:hypothetical protein